MLGVCYYLLLFYLSVLVIFFYIEMKFTEHKINHFKVYNSVAFGAFPVLCSRHLHLAPERFHRPGRKPGTH